MPKFLPIPQRTGIRYEYYFHKRLNFIHSLKDCLSTFNSCIREGNDLKNCSYVSRNGVTYVIEAIASVLKWKWSECETRKIFSTQFAVSPTVSTKNRLHLLHLQSSCHISLYWRHTDKMAVSRSGPTTARSSVSLP
jgi:hypothetical protein